MRAMERKAQGEVRIGGEVVSGEGLGGGRRTRKIMASGVEEKVSESESESEGNIGDDGDFEISGALDYDEDDAGSESSPKSSSPSSSPSSNSALFIHLTGSSSLSPPPLTPPRCQRRLTPRRRRCHRRPTSKPTPIRRRPLGKCSSTDLAGSRLLIF